MTLQKKIAVELILGHKASIRAEPTKEGYTHDWEVYVKGVHGNIQTFVEGVNFYLNNCFPQPKRSIKEPPYCVKESGYAGFLLKIEVIFKSKEEPKRANFEYDLFLQQVGGPINPNRKEKLIFKYPSEEFGKKLLAAGGVILLGSSSVEKSSVVPTAHSGSGSGGKATKPGPSATTSLNAKSSPKNSFETLFGTQRKRFCPVAPLTSSSSSASSSACSSPIPNNSDDESDISGTNISLSDSNRSHDDVSPPTNRNSKTRKVPANSRKRSKKSPTAGRLPLSPAPSIPVVAPKKRKGSPITPETPPPPYVGKKSSEKAEKIKREVSPPTPKGKHKAKLPKKSSGYKERTTMNSSSPLVHKGRGVSSYYDMEITSATDVSSPIRSPVTPVATGKGSTRGGTEAIIAAPAENSIGAKARGGKSSRNSAKNLKVLPLRKGFIPSMDSDNSSSSEEESSAHSSGSGGGRRGSNRNHVNFTCSCSQMYIIKVIKYETRKEFI